VKLPPLDALVASAASLGDHRAVALLADVSIRSELLVRRASTLGPAVIRSVYGLASGAELAQLRERQSALEHRVQELEKRCAPGGTGPRSQRAAR
jgi:hypothetical protein